MGAVKTALGLIDVGTDDGGADVFKCEAFGCKRF